MTLSYFDDLEIKNKVRGSRPDVESHFANWIFRPFNFDHLFQSFPSGHTQTVFTFAFLVVMRSKSLRIPAFIFAALVSFSRILRNVHFLSDVMGGILVAWLGLQLAQRLHFALISRFTGAHENAIALQAFETPEIL